jgi:hypothetical protein
MSDINRSYQAYREWAEGTCGQAASFDVWCRITARVTCTDYAFDAGIHNLRLRRPCIRANNGRQEVALAGAL